MNLRTYALRDRSVVFYTLKPYKNHSKQHYYPKCEGSINISTPWLKALLGKIWQILGWKL